MFELMLLRLVYGLGLGVLLAALGFIFLPGRSRFRIYLAGKAEFLIWILTILACILFWTMSVARFWALKTNIADLGLFTHTLYQTLQGNILGTTLTGGSYLLCHFAPSLIVLAIPFTVWQSPIWLMGMQAIAMASGALGLYYLMQSLDGSRLAGLVFGAIWLLSFPLRGAVIYDFHEVNLASGLLVWLAYLAVRRYLWWALLLGLLLLGLKEDFAVYVSGLGIVLILSFDRGKEGWALLVLSIVYYIVMQAVIWPWLAPRHMNFISIRFPQLAATNGNIFSLLLSNPMSLINPLLTLDRFWAILMIFIPVAFLPFYRLGWLGLIPSLWLLLSLNIFNYYIFATHYPAIVVALVLIAAPAGWRRLGKLKPQLAEVALWATLVLSFSMNCALQPNILFSQLNPVSYYSHPGLTAVLQIVKRTPSEASVTSERGLGAFFTNQANLYKSPYSLITDRFYFTNYMMGCSILPLAIGDLGYRGMESNPYFWWLARDGELDMRKEYMQRLSWMEAETCEPPARIMVADPRASGGRAVLIPANLTGCDRIAYTVPIMLPPGDYQYGIRIRAANKENVPPQQIFVEVRFVDDSYAESKLDGSAQAINREFFKPPYGTKKQPFTMSRWGKVYMAINFRNLTDYYWDGISLEGLGIDENGFDDYFHRLFPAIIAAYQACPDQTLIEKRENMLSESVVALDSRQKGQVVFSWKPDYLFEDGLYHLYYVFDTDCEQNAPFTWASLFISYDLNGTRTRSDIIPLVVLTRKGRTSDLHLECAGFKAHQGAVLEIEACGNNAGKIYLDKLWISSVPVNP